MTHSNKHGKCIPEAVQLITREGGVLWSCVRRMEFTLELESTPTHKLELELADWFAHTLVARSSIDLV